MAEREPRLGDLWAMLVYNRASWLSELGDYGAGGLARDALARGEQVPSRWEVKLAAEHVRMDDHGRSN